MSMAASLVGVIVFVQKKSLLGESLSHAAYPGVTLGVILSMFLFPESQEALALLILLGAFFSSLFGLKCIVFLERRFKVRKDSALCFILASFFGIGITIASRLQMTYPQQYKQIQVYLYGQAATMTDVHILIYGILAILIAGCIMLFYKELQALTFDLSYARSIGLPTKLMESMIYLLIVLAVVVGMRSVGVVLMSAMLIAPGVSARQYTQKLSHTFLLAAVFGIASGFFGNVLSVELSSYLADQFPGQRISVPTGPMIVVTASAFCLFALFFAPKRGALVRLFRIFSFRYKCMQENILKAIWRHGEEKKISLKKIASLQGFPAWIIWFVLRRLYRQGWIDAMPRRHYKLTRDGRHRATHIVRLHRLWEVYLVDYLGVGAERVHCNAEEMEHILTPEIEKELCRLLADPKSDPHHQPIPSINGI